MDRAAGLPPGSRSSDVPSLPGGAAAAFAADRVALSMRSTATKRQRGASAESSSSRTPCGRSGPAGDAREEALDVLRRDVTGPRDELVGAHEDQPRPVVGPLIGRRIADDGQRNLRRTGRLL